MNKIFLRRIKEINWHKLVLELIVVFLGVSSGFILNNYREGKKEIELENRYVMSFLQNTENNITELEENIKEDSTWLKKVEIIVETISQNENIIVDTVLKRFESIIAYSQIGAETNTYEDIVSSGNLNIIRNFDLKEKLIKYHKSIDNMNVLDNYAYEHFRKDFIVFFYDQVDLINAEFVDSQIIHSYLFSNKILSYANIRRLRLIEYNALLTESKELRSEIRKYLDEF